MAVSQNILNVTLTLSNAMVYKKVQIVITLSVYIRFTPATQVGRRQSHIQPKLLVRPNGDTR